MNREIPEDAYKALAYLRTFCESMDNCDVCPFGSHIPLIYNCGLLITDPSKWEVNIETKYEFKYNRKV